MRINAGDQRRKSSVNQSFRWAVGIEGSCIPHLQIDQYRWTQHERYWRDDFKRVAKELGCPWLRYTLPWHRMEKRPGVFDWRWADQRVEFAQKLGLNLIVDLIHFGTPAWLPQSFGDADFVHVFERFSGEFGRHFSGRIFSVCPINEPLITSLFCGDIGLWPPHGKGHMSYMTVLARVSMALSRGMRALRATMSGVEILSCDALEVAKLNENIDERTNPYLREALRVDVVRRMARRHIVLDLLTGRVNAAHQLYPWMKENGFPLTDLNWFQRNPVEPDILGLDYYPHTEVELFTTPEGHTRQRVPEQLTGIHAGARDYWERYRIPIMITETSFNGTDKERREWLEFTVSSVRRLREEGIPLIGYTWWPVVDHLDWDGALLHQVGHIHPVGIYRLERQANGKLLRVPTPLRDAYRALIAGGQASVGSFNAKKAFLSSSRASKQTLEAQAKPALSYPIVVHCHLRWDGVWQRPQQFLSRLSRRHRVLFTEGPLLVDSDRAPRWFLRDVPDYPNITVLQMEFPRSRFHEGHWVDAERRRLLLEALRGPLAGQFDQAVNWFYDPMAFPSYADQINESAVVYDCMDELSQFRFAPPEIVERERALLRRADVVFAGGRRMAQSKGRFNRNVHFHGCGVDVAHFSKARSAETEIPHDISFVMKPILGYFGVVDERLDYELLAKMADQNPGWSMVMIGPVAKVNPAELPRRTHLYWLGRREYAQLPAYAKAFDVCLMPFALNEATEFINPTKALEYMATGRPVVSSAVPDVISNFGEAARIAHSHHHFIELCRAALAHPSGEAVERGLKMAHENQWETIVAQLEQRIDEALRWKTPARLIRRAALRDNPRTLFASA
jgi:beta-glucosidase/6-phospho-beta-glucosidase/beta-galactosidase